MQPRGNRSRGTTGGVRSKNPLPLGWAPPAWAQSSLGISLYIMQTGEFKLKELLVQLFCVQLLFWSTRSTPPVPDLPLPSAVLWSIVFPEPSTPTSIPFNPFASTVFWRAALFLALESRRPSEAFPLKL